MDSEVYQMLSSIYEDDVVVESLCPALSATPWTVARQAPLSMGFPRQEYWSGLPFPSPGDPPDPGIEPISPALAGGFFTTEPAGEMVLFFHRGALYKDLPGKVQMN